MIIRRARPSDYPALSEITSGHEIIPSWSIDSFAREENNPHAVTLVSEKEAIIAGFINFWILRPDTEINMIAVRKDCLRQGIAMSLMKKMREYSKKSLCRSIILDVREDNAVAINFYKKEGFVIEGRRTKFYNDKYDAILMRANIGDSV